MKVAAKTPFNPVLPINEINASKSVQKPAGLGSHYTFVDQSVNLRDSELLTGHYVECLVLMVSYRCGPYVEQCCTVSC